MSGLLHLLGVLRQELVIDLGSRGGQSWSSDKVELGVASKLPCKPQEGFLEVVVRLGGDIVVLEVLLAVESDSLGLDLALLHVNLVTAENNGNVLADTDEVTCTIESIRDIMLLGDFTYGAS